MGIAAGRYLSGGLIAAVLVLLSAAPAVHAGRPVRSLLEHRSENLILQRWDNSCAAATLASVLTYEHRWPVTERRVATGLLRQTDELKVRVRGGFSLLDMKRYLNEIGFDGDGYREMSLEDLAGMAPMIVPLRYHGDDHFVIVRRLTDTHVEIGDPAFGNHRMPRAAFARRWSGTGFEVRRISILKKE